MTGFTAYDRATAWLHDTLTTPPITGVADAVYEDSAPQGKTTRSSVWIEFEALAPGGDVGEVGDSRIWTEYAFVVRAVTRGRDTHALAPVADEIDARLHRADGAAGDDGQVIRSSRTQEHHDSWTDEGVEFRSLGGQFNLLVAPLSI